MAICSSCSTTLKKVNQTMVRVQNPEVGTVATPIVMELWEISQQKIIDTTIINVYRHPAGSKGYQMISQNMLAEYRKKST